MSMSQVSHKFESRQDKTKQDKTRQTGKQTAFEVEKQAGYTNMSGGEGGGFEGGRV